MARDLLSKSITLGDVARLLYAHMLYCERNYLKSAIVDNKADKTEVLLTKRADGAITFKE